MKFLLVSLLCVTPVLAKGQVFFRGFSGGSYTAIRNKSDRDGVNGIENRLTVRPTAGVDVGYRLREGSDLQSVAIGAHYVNIAQNYDVAEFYILSDYAEGARSVQYLRIPLTLTFALAHRGRITPLLMLGAYYARQIGHRDALAQTQDGTTVLEYEASNGEYLFSYRQTTFRGEYEGSYYKVFDAGPLAGFSVEYDVGGGLFLDAGVRASYGFTRIENRTYLNHTLTVDNGTFSVPISPYQQNSSVAGSFGYSFLPPHGVREQQEPRPQSHTFAAGIEVGLKYLLRGKSK